MFTEPGRVGVHSIPRDLSCRMVTKSSLSSQRRVRYESNSTTGFRWVASCLFVTNELKFLIGVTRPPVDFHFIFPFIKQWNRLRELSNGRKWRGNRIFGSNIESAECENRPLLTLITNFVTTLNRKIQCSSFVSTQTPNFTFRLIWN